MTIKTIATILTILALATGTAKAGPMTLARLQKRLALPQVADMTNTVEISDGTNTVVLHPGYRRIVVNGSAAWLNGPAEADFRNRLTVDTADATRFLAPLIRGRPAAVTNGTFRVFIDPGHGGEDSGAISRLNGLKEKDLVLDLAMRVGAYLEDAGLDVVYSRTDDVFLALEERSALARRKGAHAFVSLHANTTGGPAARGAETFTLTLAGFDSTSQDSRLTHEERPGNAFDADSGRLGHAIHTRLPGRRGDADRGLRHARFQVLRQAPCPAVLVECGFLSNPDETRSLASPRFRERTAKAIAEGIADYAKRAQRK